MKETKRPRALKLSKETIRLLTDKQMKDVAAGATRTIIGCIPLTGTSDPKCY